MAQQTERTRDTLNETDQAICPVCGMEQGEWSNDGKGFSRDGETYCCKGCADGTGCTCRR